MNDIVQEILNKISRKREVSVTCTDVIHSDDFDTVAMRVRRVRRNARFNVYEFEERFLIDVDTDHFLGEMRASDAKWTSIATFDCLYGALLCVSSSSTSSKSMNVFCENNLLGTFTDIDTVFHVVSSLL